MASSQKSSRDGFVLLTALLIALSGAVIGWARHAEFGPSDRAIFGIQRWYLIFEVWHVVAVLLVLVALITVTLNRAFSWLRLPVDPVPLLHRPFIGASAFSGVLVLTLTNGLLSSNRFAPTLSVLIGVLAALLFLHHTYHRDPLEAPAILLTAAALAAGLLAVHTFRGLIAPNLRYLDPYRLKLPAGNPLLQIGGGLAGILIAALVGVPLLFVIPSLRRRASAALPGWLNRLPLWAFVCLPAIVLLLQIAAALTHNPDALRLIIRLLLVITLPATALIAYRPLAADELPQLGWSDPHQRRWLIGLLVILGLASIPVAISWLDAHSTDIIAYLQIARTYAEGQPAIRGLWSPLISWLLVPAFWLGFNPLILQRVLVILLGLAFVVLMVALSRRFDLPPALQWGVGVSAAIFTLRFAFWPPGPDFLATVLLVLYFVLILSARWRDHPVRAGLLIGLVAVAATYTRAFNLPYIVAHLLLTGVLLAIHDRPALRPFALTAGIAVGMLVALFAPWVMALTARYGQPTIGLAGAYNNAYVQVGYHNFCYYDALCANPPDILVPWEDPDPARYIPLAASPFASLDNLAGQVEIIFVNAQLWVSTFANNLGLLLILGLAGSVLAILFNWSYTRQRYTDLWLLLSVGLYNAGYWIYISGDFRYFYPIVPLVMLAVFVALARLVSLWRVPAQSARWIAVLLLALPLIAQAAVTSGYAPSPPLFTAPDWCASDDAAHLAPLLDAPMAGDAGLTVNQIAYYTRTRTYGALSPQLPPADIHAELSINHVRTFIVAAEHADLIDTLTADYGYQPTPATFCNTPLVILATP